MIWRPTQRGVLIGFVLALSIVGLVRLYFNREYVSDPQLPQGMHFDQLADRIDPNTATWQELAVLPQIGESRAKEIISYRETFVARQTKSPAFSYPEDLLNIQGVGPAMLATITPHLKFPMRVPGSNAQHPATAKSQNPNLKSSDPQAN